MRIVRLTAPALILGLLIQTAAAAAVLPCAPDPADTAAPQAAVDAHHGHHGAPAPDTTGHAEMPCCDDTTPVACAAGGCAASGSAAMTMPAIDLRARFRQASPARPLDWLPPYTAPPGTIFRPPIG